jgi:hypothetical protein
MLKLVFGNPVYRRRRIAFTIWLMITVAAICVIGSNLIHGGL